MVSIDNITFNIKTWESLSYSELEKLKIGLFEFYSTYREFIKSKALYE